MTVFAPTVKVITDELTSLILMDDHRSLGCLRQPAIIKAYSASSLGRFCYTCCHMYDHTSVLMTTNLSFSEWAHVFGDPKIYSALLDRSIHHCHIVETSNASRRFKIATAQVRQVRK